MIKTAGYFSGSFFRRNFPAENAYYMSYGGIIMFFLTLFLVALYFFCFVSFLTGDQPGFVSFLDTIMRRIPFVGQEQVKGGFWDSLRSWMLVVLILASFFLILNMFLRHKKAVDGRIPEVVICMCVALSFAGYYCAAVFMARYEIVMSSAHILYMSTAALSLVMAGINLYGVMKSREKGKKASILYPLSLILIFGIMFFFAGGFRAFRTCSQYSANYGKFFEEDHDEMRERLEKGYVGNFQNQAVETDEGLYFLDYVECDNGVRSIYYQSVKKMDPEGNISEIYANTEDKGIYSGVYSIGYADGYLFIANRNSVIRLDPDTGVTEDVITADDGHEIFDCCVVDNRIYYMQDIISGEERTDYIRDGLYYDKYIMVAEITGGEVQEPELYLADVSMSGWYENADLLQRYIEGETPYNTVSLSSRYQCIDGTRYAIEDTDYSEGSDNGILVIRDVDNSIVTDIENAGGINISNGRIYYVSLMENGFDICSCALDGSDIVVIDSYEDGRDYRNAFIDDFRIIIGQGKILVTASGYVYGTEYDIINDSMVYVTDLV